MQIIDFHSHFYPQAYLDLVLAGQSAIKATRDPAGNPVLHYPGDYNIVVKAHRDAEVRQAALDEEAISLQVLTLTTPGTHVEEPERAIGLARLVNDSFATIVKARPQRFTALATLPLNDTQGSVDELGRAMTDLGLKGAMLFSNVMGTPLADQRFWPLYEKANELNAILYIHPTDPVGVESMTEYWLMPLMGFLFDTTLAAGKLVFSGVVEKFPNIRWVLAHLGGTIPYLAERLDRGYEAFAECRANISKPPSEYLKTFYYDTVNFDAKALQLAAQFAGADHLLAGSDFPHQIGSLKRMKESINQIPVGDVVKDNILGKNAARLLEIST